MNGAIWLVAFDFAALACMCGGELPPRQLSLRHPRIFGAITLCAIGIIGFIALALRSGGAA